MKKEKKQLDFVQQEERGHDRPVTDGDISRLRSAQRLMDEVASRIPPFSSSSLWRQASCGTPLQREPHPSMSQSSSLPSPMLW